MGLFAGLLLPIIMIVGRDDGAQACGALHGEGLAKSPRCHLGQAGEASLQIGALGMQSAAMPWRSTASSAAG